MYRRFVIWSICLSVLVLANALTGCVYFNTFYNAKKDFKQAEKYRKNTGTNNQAGYRTAIDKALKVIENHPNSKYYDDALYVLAVSYFYTNQPARAERRFRELIANYPESKYVRQSNVYLAQSKLQLDEQDEAVTLFEDIFSEKYDKEQRAEAAMALGGYYQEEKDYPRARSYFMAVRDSLGNDAQRLEAQKFLANAYFDAFDFDDALKSYLQVLGMEPNKNDKYHALYRSAICSYRLQRIDAGLGYLQDLAKDQLYYDSIGAINLAMALGYEYAGDLDQAQSMYEEVIVQSSKNLNWVTEANYQLGLMYQFEYDELDAAKKYYDKATAGNPNSESGKDALQRSADIAKLKTIEAKQKAAREKAEKDALAAEKAAKDSLSVAAKDSLADSTSVSPAVDSLFSELLDVDSGGQPVPPDSVQALTDPEDTILAPVITDTSALVAPAVDSVQGDSLATDSLRQDTAALAQVAPDSMRADSFGIAAPPVGQADADTLIARILLSDPAVADSLGAVQRAIESLERDSTGVPVDTVHNALRDSLHAAQAAQAPPPKPEKKIDPEEEARIKAREEALRKERERKAEEEENADILFQLAELYWFQLNKPDSAIAELKSLVVEYPNTTFAPRALLALNTMYREHLADTAGADSILQEANARYGSTDFAPEIQKALNQQDSQQGGYAEYYYHMAEDFLIDSANIDSALYYYQYVVDNYPESQWAQQARFNRIWVIENYRNPGDSTVAWAYQELIDSFPGTPQATQAGQRLTYTPPPKKVFLVKDAEKGKGDDSLNTSGASGDLVPGEPSDSMNDSTGRYIDPRERMYVGPRGERLFLLDIQPVETRVEFEFPPEANSLEGNEFELYFQICLDFSGKVVNYVLKSPAPHEEINRRAERTVASLTFDPLQVNKELTQKAENITLPEEQEDPQGRWYVYKFIASKPDFLR